MVNHNVRITFAVRIADGIATGIWASSVLSTYINVLEGDNDEANEKVGYAQAIQGTFLAAAAIPAGWLAITHRRDSILKVMGAVAFAAITITSAALLLDLDLSYKYGLLCCGLALWGVAQANAPVMDALFADSVPTGSRSKLYTWLHMCYIVAQGIGPGVGALMFALNGNVWRVEVLQRVMLVGMALATIPALLMLCFDDDQALGAESEGLLRVALLQDHEAATKAADDEEAAPSPSGSRTPTALLDSPDYRRPLLDGWLSDMEQEFRNQVSPALSPARPVLITATATTASAAGGAGAGAGAAPTASHAAATAAATTCPSSNVAGASRPAVQQSASPPRQAASDGRAGDAAADAAAPAITSTAATTTSTANTTTTTIPISANTPLAPQQQPASALLQQLSSHAVMISPSMSPVSTDRSGWASPFYGTSPPVGMGGGVVGGVSAAGPASGGGAAMSLVNALAAAAAAGTLGPMSAKPGRQGEMEHEQGQDADARLLAGGQVSTAAAPQPPPAWMLQRRKSISIGGGEVPAVVAATAAVQAETSTAVAGQGSGRVDATGGMERGSGTDGGRDRGVGSSFGAREAAAQPAGELSFRTLLRVVPPPSASGESRRGGGGGQGAADGPAPTGAAAVSPPPVSWSQPQKLPAPPPAAVMVPQWAPSVVTSEPAPRLLRQSSDGTPGSAGGDGAKGALKDRRFLCLSPAWIPGVLALTDCIMGLASGMTIKFFPIFFKDEVQLSPSSVNLMYCAIPLGLSLAAFLAQRQSRLLGRVQTMVLNRGMGITLLYWIALHTERWHEPRLMVPIYILRTCIMNSIYPLQKSILMDFVPKERRAAWNSLEAVTSFGWSGSAALGGWLIHKFGFRMTFIITAVMQSLGWAMSTLLVPIVPRKEVGVHAVQARGAGR